MTAQSHLQLPSRRRLLTGAGAGAVLAAVALCRGTSPVGAVLRRPRLQDGTTLVAVTRDAAVTGDGHRGYLGVVRSAGGGAALRHLDAAGDGSLHPRDVAGPELPADMTPVALVTRADGLYIGGARRQAVGEVPTIAAGAVTDGLPEDATIDDLFAHLEEMAPVESRETVYTDRAVLLHVDGGPGADGADGVAEIEIPAGAGSAPWSVVEGLASAPGRQGARALVSYAAEADAPYGTSLMVVTVRNGRETGPLSRLADLGESGPNHLVEREDGQTDLVVNDVNGTYRRLVARGPRGGLRETTAARPGLVTSAFARGLVIEDPVSGGAQWESGEGEPAPGMLEEAEAEEDGTPAVPPLLPVAGTPGEAVAVVHDRFVLVPV